MIQHFPLDMATYVSVNKTPLSWSAQSLDYCKAGAQMVIAPESGLQRNLNGVISQLFERNKVEQGLNYKTRGLYDSTDYKA